MRRLNLRRWEGDEGSSKRVQSSVAQSCSDCFPQTLLTPPLQVNWSSLWMSYRSRLLRGWLLKPLLVLVIMIPMPMFSAALMQLSLLICPSHQCANPATGEIIVSSKSCPSGTYIRWDVGPSQVGL